MSKPIVVAASRGVGLKDFLPEGTRVSITGGGSIDQLKQEAMYLLPSSLGSKRYHIYFLCGIPDITKFERKFNEHYKECVYLEEPSVTSERYLAKLKNCQSFFVERGALPIFCTIPKVLLAKYNLFRLLSGKTATLRLTEQYAKMQENLNLAIDIINNSIYELNNKVKASTPFLHTTIREQRGCKGKRYTAYRWEKLYDGLHATEGLRPVWAECLSKAMRMNSLLEDSDSEGEDSSFKRPSGGWLSSTKRPAEEME